MNDRSQHEPTTHLHAALEASCDTLIVLESIRTAAGASRPAAGDGSVEALAGKAIETLQQAIADLRRASGGCGPRLPQEFVLARGRLAGRRAGATRARS
jgi:hypothetical protein